MIYACGSSFSVEHFSVTSNEAPLQLRAHVLAPAATYVPQRS